MSENSFEINGETFYEGDTVSYEEPGSFGYRHKKEAYLHIEKSSVCLWQNFADGGQGSVDSRSHGFMYSWILFKDGDNVKNIKLVKRNNATSATKTNMSIITKAKLLFKGDPQRSFIKAGILSLDETFTTEGKEVFLDFLLKEYEEKFKKDVVDPILEEEEKDK